MEKWKLAAVLVLLAASTVAETALGKTETVVLRAERILDANHARVVAGGVAVVVKGARIIEVGHDVAVPTGSQIIELGDVTLMPGLIDAHAHLLLDFDAAIHDDEENFRRALLEDGDAGRLVYGRRHAREYLHAGFTTVRDVGNSGRDAGARLAQEISKGQTDGPRVMNCSRALSAPGGQLGAVLREHASQEYREVESAADARAAVADAIAMGAECIKLIVDAGRGLTDEEMTAAVESAHAADVRVTAHVMGPVAGKRAVQAGVDSLDHAYFANEELLALMKRRNVALVPTDLSLAAVCELFYRDQECTEVPEDFRRMIDSERWRLRRAGQLDVLIAAGSDMYYQWPGRTRGQAALAVLDAYREAGLSKESIVRSATLDAARALGIDSTVGSIDVGKRADIIAVEGDPLQDLEALQRVRFVMRGGRIYRGLPDVMKE
ncbi:MAG: amidohydrolase family protein [Proteobacteria bacterium]|nr:amidohydrolase family protein [Pseudomonadota bacterium]